MCCCCTAGPIRARAAPDLEAAQQIASSCPHLRYGGRIVIQRIL